MNTLKIKEPLIIEPVIIEAAPIESRNFRLDEFLIDPAAKIPFSVVAKIVRFHLPELEKARAILGEPLIISSRSGYRPYLYELEKGRSGESEHTYGEDANGNFDPDKKGAVDLTLKSYRTRPDAKEKLQEALKETAYTNLIFYPWGIHVDFT